MPKKESKKKKVSLQEAIKNWRKKRSPNKIKTHKKFHQPGHKLIYSEKLKGRLLKVIYYNEGNMYWERDFAPFLYYNFKKERLGVRTKNVPIGEIVIATGNYAKFEIKEERRENDAVEVLTTKGVGYIYRTNLTEKNK